MNTMSMAKRFVFGLALSASVLLAHASQVPVTDGLALWLDAAQLTGLADGAQVETWTDMSGLGNNAIRQGGSSAGYPMYVADGINGVPVIRFNSGNQNTGDYFRFTRISTIRSVFWVLKENAGLSDGHFLLGEGGSYDFHRQSANGPLWEKEYAHANIRGGTTKLMGTAIDGTATSLPSGTFQIISLVTTGNVQANQITQDRNSHGSWQGEIAEILIYNRALTGAEERAVGGYLTEKYGLITGYAMAPEANIVGCSLLGSPAVIIGTNIVCSVPQSTVLTALAPTLALSYRATCLPASGSTQDFTTPLEYTVISSDALITNRYTMTVLLRPAPPVSDGLALWLDASQLTGLTDGAQIDTWTDLSGMNNDAILKGGAPKYASNAINGLPAVRFNLPNKSQDYFGFNRISTIRTVFWVLEESSLADNQGFLLGDHDAYHFHRGGTKGNLWDGNTSPNIRDGTTKLMGSVVNGTTTPLPSNAFKLISVVTTGNVQANQLTWDRQQGGRYWCGDIAEILIYDRALTSVEENSVGAYLAAKYALTTAYELAPQAVMKSFGGNGIASVITGNDIACTVHYATGVTNLAPVFTTSVGATCDKASGSFYDFTTPVTYTLVSADLLVTNDYTVTVTCLPDPATTLLGRWVAGATDLADIAGFTPAGTHDGVAQGENAAALAYSMDVPNDFGGRSLDLTAGNVGVRINNTMATDGAYADTFDNTAVRSQFTVSFWAKGFPETWHPWVSKNGEGSAGWQVRRYSTGNNPTFSLRGSAGSDDFDPSGAAINVNDTSWHHFAAVFDGVTGKRQLYVDGVDRMNMVGDIGLVGDASGTSLELGARSGANFFSGLLYDVRFYSMALDANEVQSVKTPMGPPQGQIYSMSFMGIPAVINETDITCTVPYATDMTTLAPTYTMSTGAMCDHVSGSSYDFSTPVTYTVTSADSLIVTVYTVTVLRTPASTNKEILTFGVPSLAATIAGTEITWMLPYGMNLTNLAPLYTVSAFAAGMPASGTARDFSTPQTVTVTAQDGSTKDYTVTAHTAPDWPAVINVSYTGNALANMNNVYSWDTEACGSASQVAPAVYGGKVWNDFGGSGANSTNLKDSKGASTGIGLTTTMWQGPWNQGWATVGNARLQRDGLTGGNVSYAPMLALTGLNPEHIYDIYIISASWGNEYLRIGTETKHLVVATAADWVENKNYLLFKRQKPNGDGTLVVEALAGTGNRYDIVLNGFQLVDKSQYGGTVIIIR